MWRAMHKELIMVPSMPFGSHEPKWEVDGTIYHSATSDRVIGLLEQSRAKREDFRLVLVLGDKTTGKVWEECTPMRGCVGRSTGMYKIPLLIRTRRSRGGEAIMDQHIIQIRMSVGGMILWDYRYPDLRPHQLADVATAL